MKRIVFLLFIFCVNVSYSSAQSADSRSGDCSSIPIRTQIRLSDQENVLIFKDIHPWESTCIEDILDSLGVTFSVATSSEMVSIDMTQYDVIIVASDQPQSFYDAYDANLFRFEEYVNQAGILEFHGADRGWQSGQWSALPGSVTHERSVIYDNLIADPYHPIVEGLYNPLHGTQASLNYFENLLPYTTIITTEDVNPYPTTIEYEYGAGIVVATGMAWEYNYPRGFNSGECLPNAIAYSLSISGGPQTSLNLHPINPPIIIPVGGGTFDYRIEIMNFSDSTAICDVWANVLLPNGTLYGPLFDPVYFTLQPGFSAARIRPQYVPGAAPPGIYSYIWYIGTYSYTIYDSASFEFEKLTMADGSDIDGWWSWSDPVNIQNWFSTEATKAKSLIHSAQPNPFNPTTTITYLLPAAAKVNLSVYDISGRLISILVDGWQPEGFHEMHFDGAHLPSGIYIYCLRTEEYRATGKMVLMK